MNSHLCLYCQEFSELQNQGCLVCGIKKDSTSNAYSPQISLESGWSTHNITSPTSFSPFPQNYTSENTVSHHHLPSTNHDYSSSHQEEIPIRYSGDVSNVFYSGQHIFKTSLPAREHQWSSLDDEWLNPSSLFNDLPRLPFPEPVPFDVDRFRRSTFVPWKKDSTVRLAVFPSAILLGSTPFSQEPFDNKRVYYADAYSETLISKSTAQMVGIAYATQSKQPWIKDDVLVAYRDGTIFRWRPVLVPLGIGPSTGTQSPNELQKILQLWKTIDIPQQKNCPPSEDLPPGSCLATEIADISFDPFGNLYCSEIPTDPTQKGGKIYRLTQGTGDKLNPSLFASFESNSFSSVPNWSGNFAFGPDGTLYLSSGARYSGQGLIYKTNITAQNQTTFLVRYGILVREPKAQPILGFSWSDEFLLFYTVGTTALNMLYANSRINPWELGITPQVRGHSTLTHPNIPIQLSNVDTLSTDKFIQDVPLAAGGNVSLAVKGGTVYQTGPGLGVVPSAPSYKFSPLTSLTNIKAVATGGSGAFATNLALAGDGAVYGWGAYPGTLGVSSWTNVPTRITSLDHANIREIHCGSSFCLALSSDGTLYFWGSNRTGLLGNGTSSGDILTPTPITPFRDIEHVSAGDEHIVLVRGSHQVYGWGYREALGLPYDPSQPSTKYISTPQAFPMFVNRDDSKTPPSLIIAIAAGVNGSLFLSSDGFLYELALGRPDPGTIYQLSWPENPSIHKVVAISKKYHTLALTASGQLFGWGANVFGEMGATRLPPYFGPRPSVGPLTPQLIAEDVSSMAAGFHYSLYWKKDGTLWGAGLNDDGQLGIPLADSKNIRNPSGFLWYYIHPWKHIPI